MIGPWPATWVILTRRRFLVAGMFALGLAFFGLAAALAAEPEAAGAKTWRVAYVEGGPSPDHQLIFQALVREWPGLNQADLLGAPLQKNQESNLALWNWLAGRDRPWRGPFLFLPDGFYSAGWDDGRRAANKAALLERLGTRRDVDLILAFGTWAGQDLATDDHAVPVLVLASNDPVASGVILSAEDSGRDQVAALFDPRRTERQLAIFHDIFRFRRLGLIYEDTSSGRAYANLADVEKSAARLGFELIPCAGDVNSADKDLAVAEQLACHQRLAPQVDAVFLTQNTGLDPDRLGLLLEPFRQAGLPTFSQLGEAEVRLGVLLSIAQGDFKDVGQAAARALAAILAGQKPRSLPQAFETTFNIAVNLRMAMNIGWDPPWGVLAAVDEIYKNVQSNDPSR